MIYGHGGDIYTHKPDLDFSVNVNPLGPPEDVVRAAKQGAERMAAYPDSRCRMLREKLSLKQGIAEDHYIFGNGAADLIYRLALAEKPGRALIPPPMRKALGTLIQGLEFWEYRLVSASYSDSVSDMPPPPFIIKSRSALPLSCAD